MKAGDFVSADTTPVLFKGGKDEAAWEAVLAENPDLWKDANLKKAGKELDGSNNLAKSMGL